MCATSGKYIVGFKCMYIAYMYVLHIFLATYVYISLYLHLYLYVIIALENKYYSFCL